MLLLPWLVLSAASAADLDLVVSFTGTQPTRVLLKDVLSVAPPALLLTDSQGHTQRLEVKVQPAVEGIYDITIIHSVLEEDRKGRLLVTRTSDPRVKTRANEETTLTQGVRIPYWSGDEILFAEERMEVVLTVVE